MDLTPVKLIVTDMDGTLLNSRHQVSSRFFGLFEALSEHGIQFAAASGRQYESIAVKLTPVLDQLVVIAENGGLVRHQGRELLSTPLDPGLRDQVLERLENIPGTHVVLCGKDTAYLKPPTPEFERRLKEYYGAFEYMDRLRGFPGEIMKIAVYHFESSEQYIFPEVQGFETDLKVKVSGAHWVDISDPLAHKGHALEHVQKKLGILPQATMVFGDYNNDLEMLTQAEFSFAMANAHPNVLKTARYQTGSNDQEGVESVLTRLLEQLS